MAIELTNSAKLKRVKAYFTGHLDMLEKVKKQDKKKKDLMAKVVPSEARQQRDLLTEALIKKNGAPVTVDRPAYKPDPNKPRLRNFKKKS